MSDAMRIVVELIEETIGKIVLRDVMEDIVKEKNAKEDGKVQIDKEESDKVEFEPYDRMNFNWIEVQALFQG